MSKHTLRQVTERIVCPKCKTAQDATVLDTWPWATYVHDCACGYTITESDWERA